MSENKFVIDGDAEPFCHSYYELASHRKTGTRVWHLDCLELAQGEMTKPELYLPGEKYFSWVNALSGQSRQSCHCEVKNLIEEFQGRDVMNACTLDFLLRNSHLIPEAWKQRVPLRQVKVSRDYLIRNPHMIPKENRKIIRPLPKKPENPDQPEIEWFDANGLHVVLFLGTVYIHKTLRVRFVRGLLWNGLYWVDQHFKLIDDVIAANYQVALHKEVKS